MLSVNAFNLVKAKILCLVKEIMIIDIVLISYLQMRFHDKIQLLLYYKMPNFNHPKEESF